MTMQETAAANCISRAELPSVEYVKIVDWQQSKAYNSHKFFRITEMESPNTVPLRGRILFWILAGAMLSAVSAALCYRYYFTTTVGDVTAYLENIHAIERGYIENIPLYDDYNTPMREMKLRTYLFPAHIDVAIKSGMKPVSLDDSIQELVSAKKLVQLKSGEDRLYYFYNVRNRYRVLTPRAACGLTVLTERFQQNIATRMKLPPVKIALSSLLRPAAYQSGLRAVNANATEVTTHSYGVSFDIYFDDYFVSLPRPTPSSGISSSVMEMIRTKFGFLLGDALRGQFRSVLMETLIQLQDEGVLFAILEKNQHCYHVTILPNSRCAKHERI